MQYNLAILIYLMRMTSALLENKSLYCEKYVNIFFLPSEIILYRNEFMYIF